MTTYLHVYREPSGQWAGLPLVEHEHGRITGCSTPLDVLLAAQAEFDSGSLEDLPASAPPVLGQPPGTGELQHHAAQALAVLDRARVLLERIANDDGTAALLPTIDGHLVSVRKIVDIAALSEGVDYESHRTPEQGEADWLAVQDACNKLTGDGPSGP